MFFVYILYSQKLSKYYIGTTDNIQERLVEHNQGENRNSFTLRGRPWELFFLIEGLESNQAYEIEKHIKRMKSSKFIENLKKYSELAYKLKGRYK
ncbi:MAG: GIY-YIG nuclease family protein [Sphingobacteriaceae bacterium]|nr:GIY-YIG nuclease family protein [Sphingobacteriaceae bacterium]